MLLHQQRTILRQVLGAQEHTLTTQTALVGHGHNATSTATSTSTSTSSATSSSTVKQQVVLRLVQGFFNAVVGGSGISKSIRNNYYKY